MKQSDKAEKDGHTYRCNAKGGRIDTDIHKEIERKTERN